MALYSFQVRLQGLSQLPEDVFENVLWYSVNGPDTVEGRCQDLVDLYKASNLFGGVGTVEVRAYPEAGGNPVASAGPTALNSPASVALPHEVAICLSYAATDDPEDATPRRRGRIYLGPLKITGGDAERPSSNIRGTVLDFGEALAAIGTASNTTWMLYSRTDATAAKIESIWCDDTWDTQRRRGLAPTLRQSRDVQ